MRHLSSWAIHHPTVPLILFALLTAFGLSGLVRLPITYMPDITIPELTIEISQPGASPTEIEAQVTRPIERALATIAGIENLSSRIDENGSSTTVRFAAAGDLDRAESDVRDAVARARPHLPAGMLAPRISRADGDRTAIAHYAVSATHLTLAQLSWCIDHSVRNRLVAIDGIAGLKRFGGVDREIRVELDPARLWASGVSASEVNAALRANNIDASGGRVEIAGSEQVVRVIGGARTVQTLAETAFAFAGERSVRLSELGTVRDDHAEQRSLARLDGRQVVSFAIYKAKGASEVAAIARVEATLAKMARDHPGLRFDRVHDQSSYTRDQFRSAIRALIEGTLLAALVIFLFLRDWRATAIATVAIPLSIIPTFWIMDLLGFSLNGISLLALSLVAGILVDDAVVEIENIERHMRLGKSAWKAAIDAADEVGLAVVATTAAIVAVFLPVGLMPGISGQYFAQFGLTVSAAVSISLVVARLFTPLMAAFLLKNRGVRQPVGVLWTERYLWFLTRSLQHRRLVLGAGAAAICATVAGFGMIATGFRPPMNKNVSILEVELPPGARLDETARIAAGAANIVRLQPEVQSVLEMIGTGGTHRATLHIILSDRKLRALTSREFEKKAANRLTNLPDARFTFPLAEVGVSHAVSIMLAGDNPAVVDHASRQLEREMRALPMLRNIYLDGNPSRTEVRIKPRFDLAAELGVTSEALGQTVRVATMGEIPQNLARYSVTGRDIPIRVQIAGSNLLDRAAIENLPVRTQAGSMVPLSLVAEVSLGRGAAEILRQDQARRVVVVADLDGAELATAMKAIKALPALRHLPPNVRLIEHGQSKMVTELVTHSLIAIATGILLVFATLLLLYGRFLLPLVNLGSLLLAPLGAVAALWITGHSVTMPVFIGLLMLFGIVAKNSILFIDFAVAAMREGSDKNAAIIDAGRKRSRPIVMTTLAMVAGMIPVAIGLDGDASFRAPMAIAVIGGLLSSTVLTLIFVPIGLSLADDAERWFAAALGRLLASRREETKVPMASYLTGMPAGNLQPCERSPSEDLELVA